MPWGGNWSQDHRSRDQAIVNQLANQCLLTTMKPYVYSFDSHKQPRLCTAVFDGCSWITVKRY